MPTGKRYEMLWDCPRCDTPGLLGLTHRHCPNCGAPQDPTRRYYPKDDQKVAVEDHPFAGADKACAACDTPNAAAAHFCVNCGASLDDAKAVARRAAQTAKDPKDFGADSARNAAAELTGTKAPPPPPPAKRGVAGIAVGLAALAFFVVCCGGVGVFAFWHKDAAVTVAGHSWVRTVAIERFEAVSDSAWRDQVPADARDVACAPAQRSTKSVPDGEDCHTKREDHGDGTFTEKEECTPKSREEPVYDDKCTFTADRWRKVREAKLEGAALTDAPTWPAAQLASTGTTLGAEREGARTEVYTVHFHGQDGGDLSCDVPQAQWSTLPVGSAWKASVGVLSGALDCSALAPAR